jgi:hypothetical protein
MVTQIDNEHGDIEVVNYVVSPRGQDNCLSPRTLILGVTMTHDIYGRSTLHTNGKLVHTLTSIGTPQPDDTLKNAARKRILYSDLSDPIVFMSVQ